MAVPKLKKAVGNSASTTLASAISNSDTSAPLASDTNFSAESGEGLILFDEGAETEEIAYATGKAGSSLTIPLANRGLEGGSAQPHSIGSSVKGVLSVGMWNDLVESIMNWFDQDSGSVAPALGSDAQGDIYYRNGSGVLARLGAGTSGQFLKTNGTGADPEWASAGDSGWLSSTNTWTYASASTFTIAGVDKTSTYTKGTRLRFKQGGAYKYAVVVGSSFSTDTTVTIAVNTDYTIANSAITDNDFSYASIPQGYPDWFTFATTWTGFSVNPTGTWYYRITGRICSVKYKDATAGTSNATTLTFTVPVAPVNAGFLIALCSTKDNSVNLSTTSQITQSTGATLAVYKAVGTAGGFTGSGSKDVFTGVFSFEY